jgi:FlaA1/EpsC-like NDP-sugar epimerase
LRKDTGGGGVTSLSGSISGDLPGTLHSKKFDLVILSHVLEHILDVKKSLENIKKLIANDGLTYIEVPDTSRYTEFFKTPYHFFDLEHINHFTESSLTALLCMNDFEVVTVGSKNIAVSETESYPAIYGFFRLGSPIEKIRNYLDLSELKRSLINLDSYVKTQEPLAIWGMGSYAKQLLANTRLLDCNVIHLIDGDEKKWGALIAGIEVESPLVLENFTGDILITSALYADTITRKIKDMGLKNNILVI